MAGGNPLALVELPGALSADERAGGVRPAAAPAARRGDRRGLPAARRELSDPGRGGRSAWPRPATARPPGRSSRRPRATWAATPGDLVAAEAAGFLSLDGDVAATAPPAPAPDRARADGARGAARRPTAPWPRPLDRGARRRAARLAPGRGGRRPRRRSWPRRSRRAATRAAARTGYATAATLPGAGRHRRAGSGRGRAGTCWAPPSSRWPRGTPARGSACSSGSGRSGPEPSLRAETAHLRGLVTLMTTSTDDAYALLRARGPDRARRGSDRRRRDARHARASRGPWPARAARRCAAFRRRTRSSSRPAAGRPTSPSSLASALTVAGRAREARAAFAALDAFLDDGRSADPPGAEPGDVAHADDLARRTSTAARGTSRDGSGGRASRAPSPSSGLPRPSAPSSTSGAVAGGRPRPGPRRRCGRSRRPASAAPLGFALITLATIEAALGAGRRLPGQRAPRIGARRRAGPGVDRDLPRLRARAAGPGARPPGRRRGPPGAAGRPHPRRRLRASPPSSCGSRTWSRPTRGWGGPPTRGGRSRRSPSRRSAPRGPGRAPPPAAAGA